ncbi:spore coat protein D [Oceanobacillus limi]|uniref:Spore coat protein D n=1 Tax=Oceanobacillus limi TaxID=930131 RepID=A0A1H9Y8R0_9BACI|nr:CotD family spore coat protein [Oceanobacillus limi]SES65325.1 spore coat protein D [Oceanobacillus limi]
MRHRPHFCKPKQVVHPTKCNVVNTCSEETIQHIHPSHTTVMNHHLIKNEHVYPHSTSYGNTVNSVDVFGGAFNVPSPGPGAPAGPGAGPGFAPGGPGVGPAGAAGRPPMPGANPWR